MGFMSDQQWLTLEEVAKRLKVHIATAQRYVREGLLPAAKLGKRYWIEESEIDQLLRRNLQIAGALAVSAAELTGPPAKKPTKAKRPRARAAASKG